ncbi:MAG: plastocyanin/azurin family copper-binding protein [Opitutales bacterium]
MTLRFFLSLFLAVNVTLFTACGGGGADEAGTAADTTASDGIDTSSLPPADRVVNITGNDAMKYSITAFEVTAGETVRLVFEHIGSMPEATMGHNVVILRDSVEASAFAVEAAAAADNGYIPPGSEDKIVARTEMIGGGDSTVVTFTAPTEAGEYPYLCTFPGHFYGGMKGTMTVVAPTGAGTAAAN